MSTLQDPIGPLGPRHDFLDPDLERDTGIRVRRVAEDLRASLRPRGTRGKTSFERSTRDGYRREDAVRRGAPAPAEP